jgi:steroid delta-isomerase-like uncharacterized protein
MMNTFFAHKTKALALSIVGLAILAGCASTMAQNTGSNADALVKAALAIHKGFNSHDPNQVAAAFTPDGSIISPVRNMQPITGTKAITDYVTGTFTYYPDFNVEVLRAHAINDKTVVEEWIIKGTWKQPFPAGPLAGKPATGKSFAVPGVSIVEIENGKVKTENVYFDRSSLLAQIGAL